MGIKSTNLECEKKPLKMGRKKKQKETVLPTDLSDTQKSQKSYIAALEQELEEQRLRVLLYRQVIVSADEYYGEDILKKIGSKRSGP